MNPDRHTTSPSDGWLSCTESMNPDAANGMSHWIMIDLLGTEQLTTFKIWNHNDPASLDNGVDLLKIQYSVDKVTWNDIAEVNVPQSDGSAFYEGVDVANFNGTSVRYILLTALSSHGGTCAGFAETRFYKGQAVPVELASFEGVCDDNAKKLDWSFADISDFGTVEVEYSTDAKNWTSIYTSANAGTNIDGNYVNKYTDNRRLNADANLYRLKMTDINGDFKYSDIVGVDCEVDENDVQIYPNPVRNQININIELLSDEEISYTVKDVLGKTIKSGIYSAKSGVNEFTINSSDFVTGNYFISLDLGTTTIEKKIIKVGIE